MPLHDIFQCIIPVNLLIRQSSFILVSTKYSRELDYLPTKTKPTSWQVCQTFFLSGGGRRCTEPEPEPKATF